MRSLLVPSVPELLAIPAEGLGVQEEESLEAEAEEECADAVPKWRLPKLDASPLVLPLQSDGEPLLWEEAKSNPVIKFSEEVMARSELGVERTNATIRTRPSKSFRWVQRVTDGDVCVVAVDGEVSSVYPGVSNETLLSEVNCLAGVFPPSVRAEVADMLHRSLAGLPLPKNGIYIWKAVSRIDLVVQVNIHQSMRYYDRSKRLVCLQVGETRDVTQPMRQHEALISDIILRHRESVDHRFGNKIRMMSLLAQRDDNDDLVQHFERLCHEVDIRRNCLSNLPPIAPVTAEDMLKEEFIKLTLRITHDTALTENATENAKQKKNCESNNNKKKRRRQEETFPTTKKKKNGKQNPRLLFYDIAGKPVHPIVMQVLLVQDLASNAFKHGDGEVRVHVSNKGLIFRNKVTAKAIDESSPRRGIGLEAMRTSCLQLNLSVRFGRDKGDFLSTLDVNVVSCPEEDDDDDSEDEEEVSEEDEENIPAKEGASPEEKDTTTVAKKRKTESLKPPLKPSNLPDEALKARAQSFRWIFVDDELLICTLFSRVLKARFGVEALVVQSPSQIANLPLTVFDANRSHTGQDIILIMDEHLIEMSKDDLRILPVSSSSSLLLILISLFFLQVTGTILRDRLFCKAPLKNLIDQKHLLLFSASASVVDDNRVLLKLGKNHSITTEVTKILQACDNARGTTKAQK